MAFEALGLDAEAVTGISPSVATDERDEAARLASHIGIAHRFVETHEMENPDYVANSAMRCFHCKNELFGILGAIATDAGDAVVVDGTNADDAGTGARGVKRPPRTCSQPTARSRVHKQDIRDLSREMGLPTWDKPAMACLASRIPHGTP